jgi:hypothetical protein
MAETPETHYVKSDDVHIAYQVLGKGPFDLLFVPGFISNIEALWRSPDQSAEFRRCGPQTDSYTAANIRQDLSRGQFRVLVVCRVPF